MVVHKSINYVSRMSLFLSDILILLLKRNINELNNNLSRL